MNIDKCTVEALKVLEQKEEAGVNVEHRAVSKRSKVIAIASALAIMFVTTAYPVYAVPNEAPITEEVVASVENGNTVYVYTRDWVNVRTSAEYSDNIVYTAEPNTKAILLEQAGDWSKVDIRGSIYYMYSHYLSTKPVTYNGDCDTDEEYATVMEKIAAYKANVKASDGVTDNGEHIDKCTINEDIERVVDESEDNYLPEDGAEIEKYHYTDDIASTEEEEQYCEAGAEVEKCSDSYYGYTESGDEVYRNDSGTFEAFSTDGYMTADEFYNYGIVNHNGECFTYYSEQVLPGEGLEVPGRYTDWEGYVCDGEGYVVLATPDEYTHPRGSTIELPTGRMGKFYDFCPEGSIDVYVNW